MLDGSLSQGSAFKDYGVSGNNACHISLGEFNAGVYRARLLWHHARGGADMPKSTPRYRL
jgi:hypothetical protein